MTKTILFCATVDYHFKAFHQPVMKWFKEHGWKVHIAASGNLNLPYVDKKYTIPVHRSPFHIQNRSAYLELASIIERENYEIIHCHTPMGGLLARLAAREARKKGTNVIYTVHGFHFYKHAPFINWLVYYPIEKWLANYTDCLITINEEDYGLLKQHPFKAGRIERINGVGVDIEKFTPIGPAEKSERRQSFGYSANDYLLFYAAEFNRNKNHQFLIHAIAHLIESVPNVKLLLAGDGELLEECRNLTKRLEISDHVEFLGFRNDIDRLLPICDVLVSSSQREGLPVNVMEGMACGLPVIATQNRGHNELVRDSQNGWIVEQNDRQSMAEKLAELYFNPVMASMMGTKGREIMESSYSVGTVLQQVSRIYQSYMSGMEEEVWTAQ